MCFGELFTHNNDTDNDDTRRVIHNYIGSSAFKPNEPASYVSCYFFAQHFANLKTSTSILCDWCIATKEKIIQFIKIKIFGISIQWLKYDRVFLTVRLEMKCNPTNVKSVTSCNVTGTVPLFVWFFLVFFANFLFSFQNSQWPTRTPNSRAARQRIVQSLLLFAHSSLPPSHPLIICDSRANLWNNCYHGLQGQQSPWIKADRTWSDLGWSSIGYWTCLPKAEHAQDQIHGTLYVSFCVNWIVFVDVDFTE